MAEYVSEDYVSEGIPNLIKDLGANESKELTQEGYDPNSYFFKGLEKQVIYATSFLTSLSLAREKFRLRHRFPLSFILKYRFKQLLTLDVSEHEDEIESAITVEARELLEEQRTRVLEEKVRQMILGKLRELLPKRVLDSKEALENMSPENMVLKNQTSPEGVSARMKNVIETFPKTSKFNIHKVKLSPRSTTGAPNRFTIYWRVTK